jgi:hypothetical protein
MSIDANKAFGMKASNRNYTLEFRKDSNGTTEVTITDSEQMTVLNRLKAAWEIITGSKTPAELAFPIRLRNSDFYHMSYIYRPNKETKTADSPKVEKFVKKAEPTIEKVKKEEAAPAVEKAAAPKARKARKPRKKASENTTVDSTEKTAL